MTLMGHRLCLRGLAKILGIGSSRLQRFRKAASEKGVCPLDGRLRESGLKRKYRPQSHARQLIHDFLMDLYVKHSEPMPELHEHSGGRLQTSKVLRIRVRKGKRPRRFVKRDDKLTPATSSKLRLLAPGSYSDYYRLFRARNALVRAGFKLFLRAARCWMEGTQVFRELKAFNLGSSQRLSRLI